MRLNSILDSSKFIGNYQLGKTIGCGSFSQVKTAVDTRTGEKYAVKIVNRGRLEDSVVKEQLNREISALRVLDHDNVVKFKDVLQTKNNIYVVMELITGGELLERISKAKKLSESVCKRYFHQLMSGLKHCHTSQIAHRDLKPENLLIDENDNLKISDFGFTNLQRVGGDPMLRTICGTPNYTAPEVLSGRVYNGSLADIWSCGVILFVMLTGKLPFEFGSVVGIYKKIQKGDYTIPPFVSSSAKDLLEKMLASDPNKRIDVADIIQHEWLNE